MLVLFFPRLTDAKAQTIQQQIDASKPGETIQLKGGEYDERIIISKPVHIIGAEDVTFIQKDSDPVITIQSDHVVIERLNIRHLKDGIESTAILLKGDHNLLHQININTSGFGLKLVQANHNKLSSINIIGVEHDSLINRQHGIDLWESHNNEIYNTSIKHVQDGIYMEKSNENKIHGNVVSHSRYGFHLMFTKNNELERNESHYNISGMMIMGDERTLVKNNTIKDNQENIQSQGLLLFDTIDANITENDIVSNRIGIKIESASGNKLSFNNVQGNYIGIQFKRANNNDIVNNSFVANVVQGQAAESSDNNTNQNYWGDHLGLDITGNYISDLTYKVDPFFLNVTNEYPAFQLLFQSPGMNFLKQLISTPVDQQLIDESPLLENPLAVSNDLSMNQFTIFMFCMSLLVFSVLTIYMGVKKQ